MMSPAMGVLGSPTMLTYVDASHTAGLTVTATITKDGEPIAGPLAATENPSLAGVYQRQLVLQEAGTYLVDWRVGPTTVITDNQALYIYESASHLHPTTIYVEDSYGQPVTEVLVVISEWDGAGYSLVAYDHTDLDGLIAFSLPNGTYRATLSKDAVVFEENAHTLELTVRQDEYLYQFNGDRITPPDVTYVPPVALVTMFVSLIDMAGDPASYRKVLVTSLVPAVYQEGASKFVAMEDRIEVETSVTGEAFVRLVPGVVVEVAVQNTTILRRFTIPATDFNLTDYLGNNDFFSAANAVYPPARRVS